MDKSGIKKYTKSIKYRIKILHLNSQASFAFNNTFEDKYRSILSNPDLCQAYRLEKCNNGYYSIISPRTEYELQHMYHLNIEEVRENLNRLHYYKNPGFLRQPLLIERIID